MEQPTLNYFQPGSGKVGIDQISSIIMCKSDHTSLFEDRLKFLQQIFATWAKLHINQPSTELQVQSELPWFNKNILLRMKTLFWSAWYEAGV